MDEDVMWMQSSHEVVVRICIASFLIATGTYIAKGLHLVTGIKVMSFALHATTFISL